MQRPWHQFRACENSFAVQSSKNYELEYPLLYLKGGLQSWFNISVNILISDGYILSFRLFHPLAL